MSFQITYRRLFEVRIMHEFFLAEDVDELFFELDENDRNELLNRNNRFNLYNIQEHVEIIPTQSCTKIMRAHKMRFIPTALGGFVGIQVENVPGSLTPFVQPNSDISLSFILRIKNPQLETISQTRFNSPTKAIYYLSNQNGDELKTFPSLAEPTLGFQADRGYEMGELAVVDGIVRTAISDISNDDVSNWQEVDVDGYVTERDRYLLPKKFEYTFAEPAGIESATFQIVDGEDTVKEISFTDIETPTLPFFLDFSTIPDPEDDTKKISIQNGLYELKVETNNGELPGRRVYMQDEWYHAGNLGALEFFVDAGDPAFDLLADESIRSLHPVFEVRLKNRLTHLRYKRKKPLTAAERGIVEDFFEVDEGVMTTKTPRPLIAGSTVFDATLRLPSPQLNYISKEGGKIYADVFISDISPLFKES